MCRSSHWSFHLASFKTSVHKNRKSYRETRAREHFDDVLQIGQAACFARECCTRTAVGRAHRLGPTVVLVRTCEYGEVSLSVHTNSQPHSMDQLPSNESLRQAYELELLDPEGQKVKFRSLINGTGKTVVVFIR